MDLRTQGKRLQYAQRFGVGQYWRSAHIMARRVDSKSAYFRKSELKIAVQRAVDADASIRVIV
jgi:hypothetical protein